MSLTLEHRWEHALIAATVAASTNGSGQSRLGRTAIQKLLYFMNILGVPMRYNFDIHHYGPFCSSVMHDVEWLLADSVIEECSQESRYSLYVPGESWQELAKQYRQPLEQYREPIQQVCRTLSDRSPRELELIATLDFAFRWVRAGVGNGPWKTLTIEKFNSIKKEKFDDAEIDTSYDSLVRAGLIEG